MSADERLNRLLLHLIHKGDLGDFNGLMAHHLRDCPETQVRDITGGDGTYGCDTGCEYVQLEATAWCPHSEPVSFEYGSFGTMWMLYDDMAIGSPGD
jgi:hypothetical protein